MPSPESILAFVIAATLLSLSPGPSNMYIMARSISQGVSGGFAAAGGLAIGSMLYVLASVFGISALFTYSPLAFTLVKIAGGLYLLYLAWQYLKAPANIDTPRHLQRKSLRQIFRQSIVVELSNPKTALFFVAFLPQFADGSAATIHQQLLILGVIYTLIAFSCDMMVATLSGKLGQWLAQHPAAMLWQDRICAGLLGALGSYILLEETRELSQ